VRVSASPWNDIADWIEALDHVQAAAATADLLRQAAPKWEGKVVPRTSMLDLLFTLPDDPFPWQKEVRVSHAPLGVFEFQLVRDQLLVTADRATTVNAPVVLDAFLMQLCAT
jgi:hypothetical protein